MTKSTKGIKDSVLKACQREVDLANYYIGFYNYLKEKAETTEEKGKIDLKLETINKSLQGNSDALAKIKEYNATI
jgi:hypothetical protein